MDAGASRITEEMKLACVKAIADLAQAEQNDEVARAYAGQELSFGPDYIIPKPFDPRLIVQIAPAVAQAAAESGVAARPIEDIEAYRQKLMGFVYHSGQLMRPLFAQAKKAPKRVIYADGEDERVLRAVQTVIDEAGPAHPDRPPSVIEMRIKKFGLRMTPGVNLEIVDPEDDGRFNETWNAYYQLKGREGVTPAIAKAMIRKHNTLIGAMLLRRGDADALLCGVASKYDNQLKYIDEIIGRKEGQTYAALNVLMLPDQTLFVTDTHVNENPRPRKSPASPSRPPTRCCALAWCRRSRCCRTRTSAAARPSRRARWPPRQRVQERAPDLEVDGEMHADAALSEDPRAGLSGQHPEGSRQPAGHAQPGHRQHHLQHAEDDRQQWRGDGSDPAGRGPPVHILTTSATVRRIVNMTALAVVDAQQEAAEAARRR